MLLEQKRLLTNFNFELNVLVNFTFFSNKALLSLPLLRGTAYAAYGVHVLPAKANLIIENDKSSRCSTPGYVFLGQHKFQRWFHTFFVLIVLCVLHIKNPVNTEKPYL